MLQKVVMSLCLLDLTKCPQFLIVSGSGMVHMDLFQHLRKQCQVIFERRIKIILHFILKYNLKLLATCFTGNGVRGACPGDSGGPAIWEDKSDDKRAYLMGVMSKSLGLCFQKGFPVFPPKFVWVPFLRDWLLSNGGKDLYECLP